MSTCPRKDCKWRDRYKCIDSYKERKKINGKPVCCGTCLYIDTDCYGGMSNYNCWKSKEGWSINRENNCVHILRVGTITECSNGVNEGSLTFEDVYIHKSDYKILRSSHIFAIKLHGDMRHYFNEFKYIFCGANRAIYNNINEIYSIRKVKLFRVGVKK